MAGDASASASEVEPMMANVALECGGDISASQEDILARSSFLGGNGSQSQEEQQEEELFTTPPLTQQDPITMCTLPFTPSPAPPSSSSDDGDMALVKPRRKPRVCTRKVRGARIRTPTQSPKQQQQEQLHVDPLYTAVLMIPTTTTTTTSSSSSNKQNPVEDFLALARQRGLF